MGMVTYHLQSSPENPTENIAEPEPTLEGLLGQLHKLRQRILIK